MAILADNLTNGTNGHVDHEPVNGRRRFVDVPPAIDIPVSGGDEEEAVGLSLEDPLDDPTELWTLLENENVAKNYWMVIALAYAKQGKIDQAIETINRGLGALSHGRPDDRLSLLNCLCWLYLWKCRDAPRIKPDGQLASEARTKDFYIQSATSALNDASRISPSYSPLFLARGVLYLLRASLLQPSPTGANGLDRSERFDALKQATKCFDDALRASGGKNMMAVLGKARVHFTLGKYAEALQAYQTVLERVPDMTDPDPRIGVGCCLWQLGHTDDAKLAWERALELNPDSKIANILLGLYYLRLTSLRPTTDPEFAIIYKKAMTEYTQKAFKLDERLPLTCATFGGYFLMRKAMAQVERLARRAIELTDVNAIASEGWYLLARKEHYTDNIAKANDYYLKADQARGGDNKGYLPAKFGAAQVKVLMQDFDGAKFQLEKLVQQSKSNEAITLLGNLYAEEYFRSQAINNKEDKSQLLRKAIGLLESVRAIWKDPKRKIMPDSSVLVTLARLYETDSPDKALQCLQQVEKLELDDIPEEERPEGIEDESDLVAALRECLPPQLLNNIGCYYYQAEKYTESREQFQTALNACVKAGEKDPTLDTDAVVTTISYNLARTYEAEGAIDEAKQIYEGLLERHNDYVDANTRLTYIKLRQNPRDEGPKAIQELYRSVSGNLDVRALYGWYLNKAKRETLNIAEDQEQRHYKHTLQSYDKHDRYSLTGMGNIYLSIARELPRESDPAKDKEKRSKMYEKAIEFFDKALQLDPKNAYAAQGVGIALVEDRKGHGTAVQIFSKVRESMKDRSVYVNLGHVFFDLKQYSRAIENYEHALSKNRSRDPQIFACLGRVWLMKGKEESSLMAMKTSLDYSKKALDVAPNQIHFQFNVAFVQHQMSQLVYQLPESQKSLEEVEMAAEGLDAANQTFSVIAKAPNSPFPPAHLEQRANMGRNTMKKQLDRAITKQKEYEDQNAARLKQAREIREAEMRKREEEKRKMEEAENERRRRIAEERQKMQERDRELAERRAEEDKLKQDMEIETDNETGEKKKRTKRKGGGKRKKKGDDISSDGDGSDVEESQRTRHRSAGASSPSAQSADEKPRKKRKRLERRGNASGKAYKSSEIVVESDESDVIDEPAENSVVNSVGEATAGSPSAKVNIEEQSDAANGINGRSRAKSTRVIMDDDEDEEDDEGVTLTGEGDVSMRDAPDEAEAGVDD